MEVYLVVPDDLKKTYAIFEQCRNLFPRQIIKVSVYSSFNEKCIGVAAEIAKNIGCDFKVDQCLNSESKVKEFAEKHFWPNYFIEILVVESDIAHAFAKGFDPGCATDAIPTDILFRLKDIFPDEDELEEIVNDRTKDSER